MTTFEKFSSPARFNISLGSRAPLQIGVALILGILLGLFALVAALQEPLLVLGVLAGFTLLVLVSARPEIVILIMIFLAAGVAPAEFNPFIPSPVGRLQVTDLILILLFLALFVRGLIDKTFHFVRTPLDVPVLLFSGAVVVGIITAIQFHGFLFKHTTPEARILLYYLIFFAITQHVRTRSQLYRLVHGILLIGLITAGLVVTQSILGRSLLLLEEEALQGTQLIRFYYPAETLAVVALMVFICVIALVREPRYRLISALVIPLLGIGLLLTLTRNVLISIVFSLAVMVIILRKDRFSPLIGGLFAVTCIVVLALAVLGIAGSGAGLLQYFSAYLNRLAQIFSDRLFTTQDSLAVRWLENQYAWWQIIQNPILGIGFRTAYRPSFYRTDMLTYYIHNGYLWIWLKTGLLGLIPFLWLSLRFLGRGFNQWRDIPDNFLKAVTLGFSLAYLAAMISNLVISSLASNTAAIIFGAMLGVNEVVFTLMKQSAKPD